MLLYIHFLYLHANKFRFMWPAHHNLLVYLGRTSEIEIFYWVIAIEGVKCVELLLNLNCAVSGL